VTRQFSARIDPMYAGNMPDKTNAEGATFLPYHLPNLLVKHAQIEIPIPVGFWRSVGHSFNAFFVESFVDECAVAAASDPLQFRRKLLASAGNDAMAKRFLALLDAVAKAAAWDQPMAPVAGKKVGRGLAIAESFHSIVAQVADVEVADSGQIRCTRVFAAVDCGRVIDPLIAKAQIASAIHFGLSATLYGSIDIVAGRVKQGNFSDFPVVTLASAPQVNVVFVDSGAALGGIGEVGTPPIAPAVANAVFAATGKRLTRLPLSLV
jgi:isoquinoline 1-oxidoreductase subunit beta